MLVVHADFACQSYMMILYVSALNLALGCFSSSLLYICTGCMWSLNVMSELVLALSAVSICNYSHVLFSLVATIFDTRKEKKQMIRKITQLFIVWICS